MELTKIYFPNLNGLRFIAAFMVIIHHVEQFLSIFGFNNLWNNQVIHAIGSLGVDLFFVLSGFLITYLLLVEEAKTKTISIKDFYIRRILRIWPLYYLIVLLALFILPNIEMFQIQLYSQKFLENYNLSIVLLLFFLPNLLLFGHGINVPFASQCWSVGVEEQFYLLWPFLMKFFKNKLILLFSVLLFYLSLRLFGFKIIRKYFFWNHEMELIERYFISFRIHCMAIGALFSYFLFHKSKLLKFLLNRYVYIFALFILIMFIGFNIQIPLLFEVLFATIILNLASSEKKGLFLENNLMNFLGKISYGLYMYHAVAIVFSIKLFQYFGWLNYHLILLFFVIVLTILIATLSYYSMEIRFIKLKNNFSKVISGENAK